MLYHVGDSLHTQNIQINKVIGENEKCIFYGKKLNGLFGQPNITLECHLLGMTQYSRKRKQPASGPSGPYLLLPIPTTPDKELGYWPYKHNSGEAESGSLPSTSSIPQNLSGNQVTLGSIGLGNLQGVVSFLRKHLLRITHHHYPHCSPISHLCLLSSPRTWTLGSTPMSTTIFTPFGFGDTLDSLPKLRFGSHPVFNFADFVCLFLQN